MSTAIEWCTETWNPTRGCSPVSAGCLHCYAERQAHRMNTSGEAYAGLTVLRDSGPKWNGQVRMVPEMLSVPLRWRQPREVFVNSMSDLFHESVPDGFIMDVWRVMAESPRHIFIILTKRAERMHRWLSLWADHAQPDVEPRLVRGAEATREAHPTGRGRLFADMLDGWAVPPADSYFPTYDWQGGMRWLPTVLSNVVLGVTCENQPEADKRLHWLINCPAWLRIVSAEPLLSGIDIRKTLHLRPSPIHGVICGGESGPRARPMEVDWARSLRDQCVGAGVDFFFKQWGGVVKSRAGRLLDGQEWNDLPWRARA